MVKKRNPKTELSHHNLQHTEPIHDGCQYCEKEFNVIRERNVKLRLIKQGKNRADVLYKITSERIKAMQLKSISEPEAMGKVKGKYWNPVYFYPKGVNTIVNEIGHDRTHRYILKI